MTEIEESEPKGPIYYDEVQPYEVTAYTLHHSETGGKTPGHPAYGITYSGKPVEAKETAACSEDMLGAHLYIPFFDETYTCTDTGSAIGDGDIDIYFENRRKALQFGRRELYVEILDQ